MKKVYLDYASATPLDERVGMAMQPYYFSLYGNPSSIHSFGREANMAISEAREKIASILNAKTGEIIFTGSGTESDNLAIIGVARANREKGNHIIISSIEHPAVFKACEALKKEGFSYSEVPVDKDGLVSLEKLEEMINDQTILASIIFANNEIGTIQPIEEIGKLIGRINRKRENPIYFHSDASQAAGEISLDVKKLGLDLMTVNGGKIYGPKGTGLLFRKENVLIEPLIYGGGQEFGFRGSTENVPGIVGLAKALEISQEERPEEIKRLKELRDYTTRELKKRIPSIKLNGHPEKRLANNINISLPGAEGESLVLYLDEEGIACSTGSACSAKNLSASHVLLALGLSAEEAHGSLRITLGKQTTKEDLDYLLEKLPGIVEKLRGMSALEIKEKKEEREKKEKYEKIIDNIC